MGKKNKNSQVPCNYGSTIETTDNYILHHDCKPIEYEIPSTPEATKECEPGNWCDVFEPEPDIIVDSFSNGEPIPVSGDTVIESPEQEYDTWSGPTRALYIQKTPKTARSEESWSYPTEIQKPKDKTSKLFITCIKGHSIVVTSDKILPQTIANTTSASPKYCMAFTVCKKHGTKSNKDVSISIPLVKGGEIHRAAEYICGSEVEVLGNKENAKCFTIDFLILSLTKDCGLSDIEHYKENGKIKGKVLGYLTPGFVY